MSASVLFDAPGPKAARRHRIIGVVTVLAMIVVAALVVWKLYIEDQLTGAIWEPFVTPNLVQLLLEGLLKTLQAAVLAIVGAVIFGLVFGVGKLSGRAWISWPCWAVVEFFRAVPLLLLIVAIWLSQGTPLGVIYPLVIGLILYNGSVLAEVFRAGINAVPKGQSEAALSIGLTRGAVTRIVLLPQAVKIMLPSIISQCVVALKDTSLGYAIVAPSLTKAGRDLWNTFDNRLATALVLASVYIVLNLLVTWIGNVIQRRYTGEVKDVPAPGGPGQAAI